MNKTAVCLLFALFLCSGMLAQDSGYYKAIQTGFSTQVDAKQFKQIEQSALKNYARAETYEQLATVFGNTTEKVWGVIYGEAYCNLSSDPARSKQIGSLVYELYAKALSSKGGNMSVNLTENAQAPKRQPPFETQFEMSFLMGTLPFAADQSPMTIKKLSDIRKNQVSLWKQRNLPETELLRRLQAITAAGHFEAYNYWLFQGARPDEFSDWLKVHQTQYQAWIGWQASNKFVVIRPDFQRLYILQN